MNKNFSHHLGSALCLLLVLVATDSRPCGQGSGALTALPTLGGSMSQGNAMNASGQITGLSFTPGDVDVHAFVYSAGGMTDLGAFGGTLAINSSGQIVGEATDTSTYETHAVIYSNGTLMDLGTLGGTYSTAVAINDAGQVAGHSWNVDGALEVFLFDSGSLINLGTLGGGYGVAAAINQAGNIAANSYSEFDFDLHAILYTNRTLVDLDTLGGTYSYAYGLNNSDMVVGESSLPNGNIHAFVYSGGVMTDIGTFGGSSSTAKAINNAGQVIGRATTANDAETHAFLYSGGSLTDLGTLGGGYSAPVAINSLGQVVGESADTNGALHAFIWQNGSLTDLNSLLPANSGWILSSAQFINDAGRIVGYGTYNNTFRYFIIDPGTVNQSPVAVAGPDQNINCEAQVTLNGSASNDPDGDALSYEWSENGIILGTSVTLTASFSIGVHTFTLKVTDPCGSSAQDDVVVYVTDAIAPSVSCPGATTISTDANCQALVPNLISQVVASDNCTPAGSLTIVQSPQGGTLVGVGSYTITVTATDASGNSASCSTLLTVVDTTAPVISGSPAPLTISVEANCQAAVPDVTAGIVASDNCTAAANLAIVQNPAAGTALGLGQHNITVTVSDASGNHASTTVSLTVVDTTAPVISSSPAPLTISVEANCQATVPDVTAGVVASDNCTANLSIVQSPAAGTALGLGQHNITVTVSDASGNHATTTVSLTVVDTTAPVIVNSPSTLAVATGANCEGAVPNVVSAILASDNCTPAGQLTVTQSPAAGTLLPAGSHVIVVTVKDASGNSTTANITLTISDLTAPVITAVSASPNVLSPPNNQLASVTVTVTATDNCDAAPVSQIISITANSTVAAGDIQITGALTANLAASKNSSGTDRVYTITVRCTDAAGNSSTASVNVTVPKSNNGKNKP